MIEQPWLETVLKIVEEQGGGDDLVGAKKAAWSDCAHVAARNAEGFVVWRFDIHADTPEWRFTHGVWPRLVDPKTDGAFEDDPFKDRRDDIPLAEFIAYLHDWYFPRRKELTGASA